MKKNKTARIHTFHFVGKDLFSKDTEGFWPRDLFLDGLTPLDALTNYCEHLIKTFGHTPIEPSILRGSTPIYLISPKQDWKLKSKEIITIYEEA